MAEKKFSELTAKGATIADTDIVAISESAGGGTYTSKSVTGANIKALVTDANMTTTDITTNDVSTSKHGFAPKAPNDTTKFLRGDATWAVVPAGGLTKFTEAEATTSPNDTVYVDSLTAAGSTTNADVAIVPKGTGALIVAVPDGTGSGGAKRGAKAVDLQLTRGYYTRVASGANSFVVGADNTASATSSIAMGSNNNATAVYSIAIGSGCNATSGYNTAIGQNANATGAYSYAFGGSVTASGQESVCIGSYSTASAIYSTALGRNHVSSGQGSTALGHGANTYTHYGAMTHAGGSSTAQWTRMIYRGNTSDATLTSLNAQEYFDDASNTFSLQNQSAYRFKGTIIGKQSGSTNIACWDIDGLIVRGANAAATTLVVGNVNLISNTPSWGTPVLSANTSLGSLKVQVQGAASTAIRWAVNIEAIEVIYA